ncbi:MAG: hypothetical protein K2N56_11830, partial [Oscillospiraceae bacterium]|nr:hypothetical protein [Oscillospiraceae bacterium]
MNIVLARKKPHKLTGLIMIFALPIVNGIMVPLMVVPPYLLSVSGYIWQLAVYSVLSAAFLLFIILGRKWRRKFVLNT